MFKAELALPYITQSDRDSVCLTFVVDSGDGVSIEHAVEEGIGVFRELRDNKDRGIIITKQQENTFSK